MNNLHNIPKERSRFSENFMLACRELYRVGYTKFRLSSQFPDSDSEYLDCYIQNEVYPLGRWINSVGVDYFSSSARNNLYRSVPLPPFSPSWVE